MRRAHYRSVAAKRRYNGCFRNVFRYTAAAFFNDLGYSASALSVCVLAASDEYV
jgi:hypothetical protein